jgi:dTDP-4-dehydrorhamnose reductase
MRILVTGLNGMLGRAIQEVFIDHEIIGATSIEMDVCNIKKVMSFYTKLPDLIIHTAAETDHHKAEFNPANTYLVNHTGTQNMVELARFLSIPIVYISTGGVFDGKKDLYTEEDIPNPINHYQRSKYFGECAMCSYNKSYIVRVGWAMGGGPLIDKKFISKIFSIIKQKGKTFYSISDVFGSPGYTLDTAKTLKNLIDAQVEYGIYHIGANRASRYEVAKYFVECLGLDMQVIPVTFEEFHRMIPLEVPYTKCEALDMSKVKAMGLSAMRDWKVSLKEYARQWSA